MIRTILLLTLAIGCTGCAERPDVAVKRRLADYRAYRDSATRPFYAVHNRRCDCNVRNGYDGDSYHHDAYHRLSDNCQNRYNQIRPLKYEDWCDRHNRTRNNSGK